MWAIDPSLAHDSDHNAIKFTIDHGLKEIENLLGIKYCMNNVDPADWTKAFEAELGKVAQDLSTLYDDPNPSSELLDTYATTLSSTIENAIAAVKNMSDARQAHQTFQNLSGEFSLPLQTNVVRNRNFFKCLCKFKKRAWTTATLENASSNDIWNFPNWAKGIRNYPTPPIARGPNRPKATTHAMSCTSPPQLSTLSFNQTWCHTKKMISPPLISPQKKFKMRSSKTAPTQHPGTPKSHIKPLNGHGTAP